RQRGSRDELRRHGWHRGRYRWLDDSERCGANGRQPGHYRGALGFRRIVWRDEHGWCDGYYEHRDWWHRGLDERNRGNQWLDGRNGRLDGRSGWLDGRNGWFDGGSTSGV